MSVLVDINMPENCFECPMAARMRDKAICQVRNKSTNDPTKRLEDCPIRCNDVKFISDVFDIIGAV